jgi:hypothetical protein
MLGWKIYWLMVALYATERSQGRDIHDEYLARAEEMVKNEWGQ